ncbi:DUF2252 family protein [Rhizobium sp. BK377]|uniref:DUF2252 family protein n=1 Tax=Rhizobium sp. BK377 TaxID=2587058 RepID=UPI001617C068|nr:DUF2252 family protein [Rhizobium sp. BK377]MBB3460876.1 uncharacterized protein (DUF2252 family) [Rhizobium sp. BK377]
MKTLSQSLSDYEAWLAYELQGELVQEDIDEKHRKMCGEAFAFLRATYWRWAEIIYEVRPELADMPQVLSIGDTHLENFGTWRDIEGRLVWGANDFDDAAIMPYGLDLVRLVASAILAQPDAGISGRAIAELILAGYVRGLEHANPIVLERDHPWLRDKLLLSEDERKEFWKKWDTRKPAKRPASSRFVEALKNALPKGAASATPLPVTKGTGSLGRPRFVAYVNEWRGGPVLREAKALVPSAWSLARSGDHVIRTGVIAAGRMRSPDPHFVVSGRILVRRLSPNSRKIEIKTDAKTLLNGSMLELMGFEIANCHSDDPAGAAAIRNDLRPRGKDWLYEAARSAAEAVQKEWKDYRIRAG